MRRSRKGRGDLGDGDFLLRDLFYGVFGGVIPLVIVRVVAVVVGGAGHVGVVPDERLVPLHVVTHFPELGDAILDENEPVL